jgi:hypothetical protein
VHRRFLRLRACWSVLRGDSVAYRVNFTEGGGDGHNFFAAECTIGGEPMTPWHFEHCDPEPQPE